MQAHVPPTQERAPSSLVPPPSIKRPLRRPLISQSLSTWGIDNLFLNSLGHKGKERRGVGAHQLAGLLAVLEEHESWHGADAEFLAQLGELIDVDLGEEDILEFLVVGVSVMSRNVSMCLGANRKSRTLRGLHRSRWRGKCTHPARMGAMALQGPHHVAKQSSRTALLFFRASFHSSFLFERKTC